MTRTKRISTTHPLFIIHKVWDKIDLGSSSWIVYDRTIDRVISQDPLVRCWYTRQDYVESTLPKPLVDQSSYKIWVGEWHLRCWRWTCNIRHRWHLSIYSLCACCSNDSHGLLTDFARIGLGLCYDVRFPEPAMIAARKGMLWPVATLFFPCAQLNYAFVRLPIIDISSCF